MGSGFFHRWGLLVFLKSGIHAAWMLAFASMTFPPPVMPDPDRASRAMIPYFSDASRQGKAVFMLTGSSLSQG